MLLKAEMELHAFLSSILHLAVLLQWMLDVLGQADGFHGQK